MSARSDTVPGTMAGEGTEQAPTRTIDYHIGRSWTGSRLEDECPCPQEPCGLIAVSKIDPECPQHAMSAAMTTRQNHYADACPGRRRDGLESE
jgi:hypothetical protein